MAKKFLHLHADCEHNINGICAVYDIEVVRINYRCGDYKSTETEVSNQPKEVEK